jgi:hypothetical protein
LFAAARPPDEVEYEVDVVVAPRPRPSRWGAKTRPHGASVGDDARRASARARRRVKARNMTDETRSID